MGREMPIIWPQQMRRSSPWVFFPAFPGGFNGLPSCGEAYREAPHWELAAKTIGSA
jgi:hypothetical protein